jgi:hypothetical protein
MFAFLFSKVGAWVAGIAIVGLMVGGGYFYVKHQQRVIADLKSEVANLKLGQSVLDAKQQKYDEFMKTPAKVKTRVIHEKEKITQDVRTVDDAGLERLYDNYRLLPKGEVQPAGPGRKSGAQHSAPGAP